MTDKNKPTGFGNAQLTDAAAAAADAIALEEQAKAEPDIGSYTHTFKRPFSYMTSTLEKLTFNWETLTGDDHVAIENELLRGGKTLLMPEFSSEFLCCMAVRACTERNADGFRVVSVDMMKSRKSRQTGMVLHR